MFTSEFERRDGRREAMENRDALAKRAAREAEDASRTRRRLELGSSGGARLNFAKVLNALAKVDAQREAPGLDAIANIRRMQRHGYKSGADHTRTHDRLERAGFLRGLID